MKAIDELIEAKVLAIVESDGRYVGKLGCVLCLPLRNAAARLVEKDVLQCLGTWDGQQVWVKPTTTCSDCGGYGEHADDETGDEIVMCMKCGGTGVTS